MITNQEQFARLPVLLSYHQVLSTGIKEHDITRYVSAGTITFIQTRPNGRRRYHKRDIAKLLGFES